MPTHDTDRLTDSDLEAMSEALASGDGCWDHEECCWRSFEALVPVVDRLLAVVAAQAKAEAWDEVRDFVFKHEVRRSTLQGPSVYSVTSASLLEAREAARRAVSSVPQATEGEAGDSDPADYGYVDLPSRGGVKVIPNIPPELATCRSCGHVATEHTPGRFSIYGTCPGHESVPQATEPTHTNKEKS